VWCFLACAGRPVWFDLEPSPIDSESGSGGDSGRGGEHDGDGDPQTSQAVLRSWGFFELADSSRHAPFRVISDERGSGVVTVQCHVLERFLEVCARLVGIDVRLGVAYAGVCSSAGSGDMVATLAAPRRDQVATLATLGPGRPHQDQVATLAAPQSSGRGPAWDTGTGPNSALTGTSADTSAENNPEGPLTVPMCTAIDNDRHVAFDLLLGADGPRSAVRSSLGLAYPARSAFSSAGGQLSRAPSELSQVTLIVSFALDNATGRCPQPRRDAATGLPDPPYEVSFDELGVSSVFKRLYEPYCELQVRDRAATIHGSTPPITPPIPLPLAVHAYQRCESPCASRRPQN
jgi:hypothetical protein